MGNSIIIQMLRAHITRLFLNKNKVLSQSQENPQRYIQSLCYACIIDCCFFKMVKNIVKMY